MCSGPSEGIKVEVDLAVWSRLIWVGGGPGRAGRWWTVSAGPGRTWPGFRVPAARPTPAGATPCPAEETARVKRDAELEKRGVAPGTDHVVPGADDELLLLAVSGSALFVVVLEERRTRPALFNDTLGKKTSGGRRPTLFTRLTSRCWSLFSFSVSWFLRDWTSGVGAGCLGSRVLITCTQKTSSW